jgi:hypothetical protein
VTTLDCVLLKDNNRALVAISGPEINARTCLCTTRTKPQYQMLVTHPAFDLASCVPSRDPPSTAQVQQNFEVRTTEMGSRVDLGAMEDMEFNRLPHPRGV